MLFYIWLFAFCVIMFIANELIKEPKHKKIFEIVTLIILCIISGTRYYLGGTDYYVYKIIFQTVPELPNFDFLNVQDMQGTYGAEIGYLFFNSMIKTIGFNFFGFTLINSIIFYGLLYIGLKRYNKNFNFLIIIFLYKMFFYNTFISMRQSITIAIFFIAIKYIQEKKPIKYFLCSILAVTFHNGALILFLVYFINKFKLTKDKVILLNIIFIPTIILSMMHAPILKGFDFIIDLFSNETAVSKAENLINSEASGGISLIHTCEYFLIMLLVIRHYDDIIKIDKNAEFMLKIFIVLLPIFTIFRGYTILTRMKDYFTLSYATILYYICQIKEQKYATPIQATTIAICLYGFIRFIILFDDGGMIPYQSYIFNGTSIF